jgi:hypothetical protein
VRIGNASGFYGDRFSAWSEMLEGGDLDVLTGDYLAELTMLILGRDLAKSPDLGYAKTFLRQLDGCLATALDRGVTLVTNAGGVNPAGLASAVRALAGRLGRDVRVASVEGDDVRAHPAIPRHALTANAYLGAFGIAECVRAGADVVVTGRVTDASLVIGPAIAHFGWTRDDLDALAGATVAGHVIECGAQATGGNYPFFTELPDGARRPGFPIAEVEADGSSVITKHPGTGGAVTVGTVTAQLLYEVDSPAYRGPDVVAHLDSVLLRPDGPDRVRISGVRGSPPPPTVKVGVSTLGGFRNSVTFVLCGLSIDDKAQLVRDQLTSAVGKEGLEFRLARTDHPDPADTESGSALLHVHLKDPDAKRAGRAFSAAAVELALASYPGCTMLGPPGDAAPYGVFEALAVPQGDVAHTAVLADGTRVPVPPPARTATDLAPGPRPRPATAPAEPTTVRPLGTVVGARSGDKGADANLGVWARDDAGYEWLQGFLTVDKLKALLPEASALPVERHDLPNLRAVNFVLRGLLGAGGVAASTRFDPQAKALGELLRAKLVEIPVRLVS